MYKRRIFLLWYIYMVMPVTNAQVKPSGILVQVACTGLPDSPSNISSGGSVKPHSQERDGIGRLLCVILATERHLTHEQTADSNTPSGWPAQSK